MNVKELIDLLKTMPEDAPVYAHKDDPDFSALMVDVVSAQGVTSEHFGAAVILETEEL
jgi:hypothetical protein